jgi:catechol 2,3-dioxygenase-like lactoylglutathione lyase family enzyme
MPGGATAAGAMIGYVTLGTDDLERARSYYDALLATIGARRIVQFADEDGGFTMYGTSMGRPALVVTRPYDKRPMQVGNGNMVALVMDSTDKVDAFHAKALELGGTDEGAPGYRGDPGFGYYFGYFRDPDGHKLAVFNIAPKQA